MIGDALTRLPDVDREPTAADLDRDDLEARFEARQFDDDYGYSEAAQVEPPANIDEADWQLRKLGRLNRRIAENEEFAARRIAEVKAWLERENGKLAATAAWYHQNLRNFHEQVLADDPARKTISLPGGVLKARKHPDRWDVDAEVFLAWAKENAPQLVRVKEEPAKAELKKFATVSIHHDDETTITAFDPTTGEEIPGVSIEPGGVAFVVDTEVKG